MPTIRIATDCTLPPAGVLYAAYDFGPNRTLVWPAVHAEHLSMHHLGGTTADVTEGTPVGIGINWERCHYDWSQPGRVTATVTGSNVYAHPGSSWQLTRGEIAVLPGTGHVITAAKIELALGFLDRHLHAS